MNVNEGDTSAQDESTFDCKGTNTEGVRYSNIREMWEAERKSNTWYEKSIAYWRDQAASIDGMLGGLSDLDGKDVAASRGFLQALLPEGVTDGVALDCGAGIGRVTKHLLLPMFRYVDMLEQNEAYLEESVEFMKGSDSKNEVKLRIPVGMQNFSAGSVPGTNLQGRYSLIWIQWSIIYLGDDDFVSFLRHCVNCLAENGIICIKDNLAKVGFLVDKTDSSIMRSDKYMKALFEKAGLRITHQVRQTDFPHELLPVKMYALRPKEDGNPNEK